jgi:PRC-barrel domain protein
MGRILPGAVVGAMLLLPAAALAQDQGKAEAAGGKIKVEKVLRTSTIKGMKVYNNQGDRVGTLDELVIDIEKVKSFTRPCQWAACWALATSCSPFPGESSHTRSMRKTSSCAST